MDYQDYILKNNNNEFHFWFSARLKLIENLLKNFLFATNKKLILDLGCGTGTELEKLAKYGTVSALDINQSALALAKEKKCQAILADIEKFTLPKENYDVICCFDLLEHLNEDEKVLNNICQSLKNNGYLFFTVPAVKSIFSTHDLALSHRRRYNREELNHKLIKTGFTVMSLGYWNSILFPLEAAVRIIKRFLYFRLFKKIDLRPDTKPINSTMNKIFFAVLNLENILIDHGMKFPFGLTIYGVAKKNVS
ncbi:class I SAM-dependent methyltransferase [Candidatus Falkowbacteria bacterium]|nr:class I SAM-dependent methyltransferase [Candidatus Falkowbacteria bacterium]